MSDRAVLDLVPGPSTDHVGVPCTGCDSLGPSPGGGLTGLRTYVTVVIIGVGFTLAVVFAFAAVVKWINGPNMNRRNSSRTSRLQWEDVLIGGPKVDAKVIKSLPLVAYSEESFEKLNLDMECAVCLSQFQEAEELRLLPKCKHMFHCGCIDGWLLSHPFCPLCRTKILSTSWARRDPLDSHALGTSEASIPGDPPRGSREDQQQRSRSLDPHVEIPVLDRFEALRDNCYARKGTGSSGVSEMLSSVVHTGELEKCARIDLQPVPSPSGQENVIGADRVSKPENCDLPISAVCISISPDVKNLDTDFCHAPQKGLCGDRILEEGSSSTAPSSSEDTCHHR